MRPPLRSDLAFQRYQTSDGELLAAYSLAENRFSLLEEDAAVLMGKVLEGDDPQDLLAHAEEAHGTAARDQVSAFFEEALPLFQVGSTPNRTEHRQPPDRSSRGTGRDVEEQFFTRCADEGLFSVSTWELSYVCNLRCAHCYNPHHEPAEQLETSTWLELIDQARDLGLIRLGLTGGEAGIHPGFWKILEHARSRFLAVDVLSNGIAFAERSRAEDLAVLFPRSVQCSLYGASAEVHEGITGVQGSWLKTVRCLEHFADLGVPIVIKCPAMSPNHHQIPEVGLLAERLGASLQVDVNITARNDGETSPTRFRLNETQLAWLFRQPGLPLYQSLERIDQQVPADQNPCDSLCGAGTNGLGIQPDGTVVPCLSLMHPIGKIPPSSLREIWEGPALSRWRGHKRIDRIGCRDCDLMGLCSFCPGMSLNESGNLLTPNTNDCHVARVRAAAFHALARPPHGSARH